MMAAGLWQGERRDNYYDFSSVFSILNQLFLFREIMILVFLSFFSLLLLYIYIQTFVFIYICFYPLLSYILFSITWGSERVIILRSFYSLFFLIFYFTHQSFRFISFLLFLILLLLFFLILVLYFLFSKNLSLKIKYMKASYIMKSFWIDGITLKRFFFENFIFIISVSLFYVLKRFGKMRVKNQLQQCDAQYYHI